MATTNKPLSVAEEILSFHEGSAEAEHEGAHPTVRINADDFAAALADVRASRALVAEMRDALAALTDPEGHIWHGSSGVCTGECRDVRAALAKAEAR